MDFIKVAEPLVGEEEVNAVREVLLSGMYVSGKKVKEFEEKFAEYIGTKYAIATSSGTAALHIALACLDIGPGDEVIVPPMTFFATIEAVLHQNAIPIFADIDENYCMDPESIEKVITNRTKAIIPVHLFGYSANMKKIMKIARKYDLYVIEDCAQAHGTEYYGKKVGSIGHIGAFSFFATKNMTTGEGGMITTNDEEVAKKAKMIRSHGMIDRDNHIILGYNYRMTEMEAAFGLVQLSKLDKLNEIRIKNSRYLLENLKDIDWIIIQKFDPNIKHTFFWCPIRINEERLGRPIEEFKKYLIKNGIGFRHRYKEPLYRQVMLLKKETYPKGCPLTCAYYENNIDYSNIYLKNAEKFAGKIIGLPNHPKLRKNDLDRIIETIKSYI